jgi:hypothetical protein
MAASGSGGRFLCLESLPLEEGPRPLQGRDGITPQNGGLWPSGAAAIGVFLPRVEQRGEAVRDPRRHFATVNCRIAKGLFNHLVGDGENRRRHLDADRSRRLQVDDELEFG